MPEHLSEMFWLGSSQAIFLQDALHRCQLTPHVVQISLTSSRIICFLGSCFLSDTVISSVS